jgi:hypothetical protein
VASEHHEEESQRTTSSSALSILRDEGREPVAALESRIERLAPHSPEQRTLTLHKGRLFGQTYYWSTHGALEVSATLNALRKTLMGLVSENISRAGR